MKNRVQPEKIEVEKKHQKEMPTLTRIKCWYWNIFKEPGDYGANMLLDIQPSYSQHLAQWVSKLCNEKK